jgi:hypothetical protein
VAPRMFLRELTDVLDRVDQYQDFDPLAHYKLELDETRLQPEELAAARGETMPSVPDGDDEEPPPEAPKAARRLDG